MSLKSSYEILNDLLSRGAFSIIYVEQNFPLPFQKKGIDAPLNPVEAESIIVSSAVAGASGIGFFHSSISPRADAELHGVAVFVSTRLPRYPLIPVIFCRDINHISERYNLAIKISEEFKIPVMLCINDNALVNFMPVDSLNFNIERVSPHISLKTFDNLHSNVNPEKFESIYKYLKDRFKDIYEGEGELSFYSSSGRFFAFYVPYFTDVEVSEGCFLEKSEITFIKNSKYEFKKLHIKEKSDTKNRLSRNILCPGCPFITITRKLNLKDKICVTDINCPSVKRIFGFVTSELENVIGLSLSKPNSGIFFVGNLSNLKQKYLGLLKNIEFIFLNDGVDTFADLPVLSRTYKLKNSNVVLPYSCNNIAKGSPLKVNFKKCVCLKKNESPFCVDASYCPALYEVQMSISINEKKCVGCRICESACPYGAI